VEDFEKNERKTGNQGRITRPENEALAATRKIPRRRQGLPRMKSRKNYLSLVRTHRSLAERHGLRETDLF